MAINHIKPIRDYWHRYRNEKPYWMILAGIVIGYLIYYLLVINTFNSKIDDTAVNIDRKQNQAIWIAKASQEVSRLRQTVVAKTTNNKDSAFNLVNQAINEKGWTSIISDLHQVEDNRIQLTFNAISFNELTDWLENLYTHKDVFVAEANINKTNPGVVQATLILQKNT